MKERAIGPLMSPGVVHTHSTHDINTFDSKEDVADRIRKYNTLEYIRRRFFPKQPHEEILFSMSLPEEQGRLSVIAPSGFYYPDAVMVIAATENMLKQDPIDTYHVADLPPQTHQAYWTIVRKTLKFNPQARYVENAASTVSDLEYRAPRSISLPHGQIGSFKPEHITPFAPGFTLETPEFLKELQVLSEDPRIKQALFDINSGLKKKIGKKGPEAKWSMYGRHKRDALPMGYSIFLDGKISDKTFADFMATHFEIYSQVARSLYDSLSKDERKLILPQPSFRLYVEKVTPDEVSDFMITVSPMTYSHAGVNEAAGVLLHRSPSNKPMISSEDRAAFLQSYVSYFASQKI